MTSSLGSPRQGQKRPRRRSPANAAVRLTTTDRPATFLRAVREDPGYASKLAVLDTMAQFVTHVAVLSDVRTR